MEAALKKTGGFKRNERIKKSAAFKALFKNGKRTGIPGAKLFYAKNGLRVNRVGFPLSRGYGNAVQRNISKRYSREVYRLLKAQLNIGYDMLFLLYPGCDSFDARCAQFRLLCKKAGLITEWNNSLRNFSVFASAPIKSVFLRCFRRAADTLRRVRSMRSKRSENTVRARIFFSQ